MKIKDGKRLVRWLEDGWPCNMRRMIIVTRLHGRLERLVDHITTIIRLQFITVMHKFVFLQKQLITRFNIIYCLYIYRDILVDNFDGNTRHGNLISYSFFFLSYLSWEDEEEVRLKGTTSFCGVKSCAAIAGCAVTGALLQCNEIWRGPRWEY